MKVKVKWKWKQGLLRCQHWLGFKCPQSPSRRTDWSNTNWGFTFNRKLLKEQQIWQNTNWRQKHAKKIPLGMKQPDSDTFLFSEKIVQLLQMQHTWNKKHHIIPFYRVQIKNTMFIAYHCCIAQNELTHIGCLVFLLPQSLPNGQSQATCVSFSLDHPQLGKLWRAIKSKFLIVGTHVEVEWMCAQNCFFLTKSRRFHSTKWWGISQLSQGWFVLASASHSLASGVMFSQQKEVGGQCLITIGWSNGSLWSTSQLGSK